MKRRLKPAKHHLRKKHKRLDRNLFKICRKLSSITVGAALASIGLEIFLIPNNIIDGGVVGISIMASYLSGLPVGLFLLVLNLPFLFLGYRQIGKTFALFTLYAVICLSVGVSLLHAFHGMTDDDVLAALFGGVILGMGVGLIIRNGGSLDGTEIVAIIFDRRTSFSIGEIVMFFNLFILSSAGVVFGWENAMYSLLAYYVAFKTIDVTIEGLNSTKGVFIVSEHYIAISDAIRARLGREYSIIKSNDDKNYTYTIFVMVTRLEIAKLKLIVSSFDKDAMIAISSVEIEGKRFQKKAIH
ncbi:MAG: hypothetical protein K0Q48_1630 [Bacillota bacterium]|jgi:uncharacterized membrane-anchored protein YitT (DUF2179 family)|nr:hypothetical protein [Bacillota bacterium]